MHNTHKQRLFQRHTKIVGAGRMGGGGLFQATMEQVTLQRRKTYMDWVWASTYSIGKLHPGLTEAESPSTCKQVIMDCFRQEIPRRLQINLISAASIALFGFIPKSGKSKQNHCGRKTQHHLLSTVPRISKIYLFHWTFYPVRSQEFRMCAANTSTQALASKTSLSPT